MAYVLWKEEANDEIRNVGIGVLVVFVYDGDRNVGLFKIDVNSKVVIVMGTNKIVVGVKKNETSATFVNFRQAFIDESIVSGR